MEEAHRKWRRVHGLQWPWHPQQVTAWFILIYFFTYTFFIIIPNFNSASHVGLIISHILLYVSHFVTHAVAKLLDPADPNLRALSSKEPIPEFDRNKHAHVIENGRCHLCNISISSQRTKHCSVCNKCVDVFDHHCKWLNQCIGERNYSWFVFSVATAIIMALSFIVMSLTLIGLYYGDNLTHLQPWENLDNLNSSMVAKENSTEQAEHFEIFFAPVDNHAYMALTFISLIVAFVAFALLLHLALFHVYINHVGITTYEYVRAHRLALEQMSINQLEQELTTDSKCCQIFSNKISPTPTLQQPQEQSNVPNGSKKGSILDEKLPPIHLTPPKKVLEVVPEDDQPKGSTVPKLPKLDNNGLNHNNHPPKRPQLAKVHKHLESVDFEDQDKIFVVEVS